MRYYVVADVHGYYEELITALTEKGFFEDKEPHKLIVCGDLFDRGYEAVKLQQFILELMDKDEVILIRGNHEDLAIELIENIHKWMTAAVMYTHHWRNGTVETVLQLTEMRLNEACKNPSECAARMNETPFLKQLIPAMLDYFETENYIFVHGWIALNCLDDCPKYWQCNREFLYDCDWRNFHDKEWEEARWQNGFRLAHEGFIEENKTIVCGHWHTSWPRAHYHGEPEFEKGANFEPYYDKGIIGIDACTAHSKKVNILVLEDNWLNEDN